MGPSEQSEAIVLRTRAGGESDKIAALLTAAADAAQFMGRLLAAHLRRPLRSVKLIAALTHTPAVG